MIPEDRAGRIGHVDDHEAVDDIVDVRVGADRVPVRPETVVVVGRGRRCVRVARARSVSRTIDVGNEVGGVALPTYNKPVADDPFGSRSVDSVDLVAITCKTGFLEYGCILSVLG